MLKFSCVSPLASCNDTLWCVYMYNGNVYSLAFPRMKTGRLRLRPNLFL